MLDFDLRSLVSSDFSPCLKVCAVSYLNTLPLVWGMLHGEQRGRFDLSFAVPSVCADRLASGEADIGIVPCAELPRLGLEVIRGTGIACRGPVRSILLISRVPFPEIARLAVDVSSRTSVQLARIILAERYGAEPVLLPCPPDLDCMLAQADAALIIGDPALLIDPAALPYHVLDLGDEWWQMTRRPMVFAVWAGRPGARTPEVEQAFRASYEFGRERFAEIASSVEARGIPYELGFAYLRDNMVFELGPEEYAGLDLFLESIRKLPGCYAEASETHV